MQCKDLQTKLAVNETLTPDEQRHVDACSECAQFAAFDATLEPRLADWRVPAEALGRRTVRAPFRLAYAGAGLAAALTLAVIALPSRSNAQESYRKMLGRIRTARSVHMTVLWRNDGPIEKNPLEKRYELWWKPGAWREQWKQERPSLKLKEADGVQFYRFDPKSNTVQHMNETSKQDDFANFDLLRFADKFMATPTQFAQPTPTTLIATNAGNWSRMVFTLDPATGLPTHATKMYSNGHVWEVSGEIDLELNLPVDEGMFDPKSLEETPKP